MGIRRLKDFSLSSVFLKRIGDYMLVETPLAKADACILFGNGHAVHLARHAAKLYHQGYFDTIVTTGGVPVPGDPQGKFEAVIMRNVLIRNGVPASAILVEDKATNTGENVFYTKALLAEKGLDVKSVIGVGHIHGSRRFLMTLEAQWPEVTKMFSTNNCYKAPRAKWYQDSKFRSAVLYEYSKIAPYKAAGYIREIDMDKIRREALALKKPPKPPHSQPGQAI